MDLCQLIELDHRAVLSLSQRLHDADDPATAKEVYRWLRDRLSAHERAEETVAYGALDQLGQATLVMRNCEGEVEHNLCDHLLAKMTRGRPEHPGWKARAKVLHALLDRHVQTEQQHLLPALRLNFNDEQLGVLGQRYAHRAALLMKKRT
jgi:Hemerythrin HHE cation binding domain